MGEGVSWSGIQVRADNHALVHSTAGVSNFDIGNAKDDGSTCNVWVRRNAVKEKQAWGQVARQEMKWWMHRESFLLLFCSKFKLLMI